ncbi:MAG: hypothetical protein LBC30_00145 [Puniceicoccales bacterium]|jgi:hypothetical protein|nr:hypothetical protein [Puniceicoccales bacterium]
MNGDGDVFVGYWWINAMVNQTVSYIQLVSSMDPTHGNQGQNGPELNENKSIV